MGTVYKETYTKPIPDDVEFFIRKGQHVARWTDRRGRKRTEKVTTTKAGHDRLLIQASTYTAKYRNGSGVLRKAATGCRTLDAAKAVLNELETRADKVRCGNWTAAEDSVLDHQTTTLGRHITAYLDHLGTKRGKGGKPKVSSKHVANVEYQLRRIVASCKFRQLRDLNRPAVERWIKGQLEATQPLSARTINAHLAALTAFGNWCIETKRIVANPFARPPKLDEKADVRRHRRSLTDDELRRLLHVARYRPLAEYGRQTVELPPEHRKGRRTWTKAPLTFVSIDTATHKAREVLAERPDFIEKLEETGRERSLIYKTLVLTGLRKSELASLTVGQLDLDDRNGSTAYATLKAADDKAGKGADVPLRSDLANDLRQWIADKLDAVRAEAKADGRPLPVTLTHHAPLFNVPTGLIRILDRDLDAAGIPKTRRSWPNRGRSRHATHLRHASEQRRRVTPYRTSGHAAFNTRPDDEHLYRSAIARCGRRDECVASVAAGRHASNEQNQSYWNRPTNACTAACTNSRQSEHIWDNR